MRAAQHSDFDLAYDIYTDETVNPFMSYAPMDKKAFQPIFDDIMARDYFWIFQDENAQDCGMASVTIGKGRTHHVAEIRSLGIQKDKQNKGLGRTIMKKVVDALKSKDIERVQLFAEADNTKGIKFYEALGFKQEGRMKNYFKRGPGHYVDEIIFGMTELT